MSPRKEALVPVKENIGSGTGMGTFTPICPTSVNQQTKIFLAHTFPCVPKPTSSQLTDFVDKLASSRTAPSENSSSVAVRIRVCDADGVVQCFGFEHN